MKVGLLSPDYGAVCSTGNKFTNGSDRVYLWQNGHTELVFAQDAVDIASVRNKAMHHAIAHDCDRLLMVDSDVSMLGGDSSLQYLMPTMTKKKCAAAGIPVMLRRAEMLPDGRMKNTVNCSPVIGGEVYRGRVATGILLIDLHQVKDIPEPWFLDERNDNNTQRTMTQDMYFIDKLRAHGLKVYVDFRGPTSHKGRQEYSTEKMIHDRYTTDSKASR